MGKFGNSDIHERYSDWHWNLVKENIAYKRLYVSDIDRLWIEYDFYKNAIVGVMDIKYDNRDDRVTPTEEAIYKWFEKYNAKCYVVYISQDFSKFRVLRYKTNEEYTFTERQYSAWLLSLRTGKYFDFQSVKQYKQEAMFGETSNG